MGAATPITNITLPSEKDLLRAICAVATYTSAGATTEVTVTLDNCYPQIDTNLQCPILGILAIADETAVAVDDIQIFLPTGLVPPVALDPPDGAGEWQFLPAAPRQFIIYNTPDKNGKLIVCYIPKGTGQIR